MTVVNRRAFFAQCGHIDGAIATCKSDLAIMSRVVAQRLG